jgi:RimJ/RimL family protein N-acetyltransferase
MRSQNVICLQSEHLIFRPLEPEDIPSLARWLNDPTVTYYLFYGQRPLNVEQYTEEFRRQVQSPANVVFAMAEKSSGTFLGVTGLYDIHLSARKAELRIHIGDTKAWGKGYGIEGTELLTYYGFDRLNLNRVYLGVTEEHERAVRAYEHVGYKVEGRLRQDLYRNSNYYDSIRMSILREEYYPELFGRHRRRFSPPAPNKLNRKGK